MDTPTHDHPLCAACRARDTQLEQQAQQIAELQRQLAALMEKVTKLTQLHFGKQKPADPKRRRKHPGKKSGMAGTGRRKPAEPDITNHEALYLAACPDCGTELTNPVASYERIVEDIPLPHQPVITSWEIMRYDCAECGQRVHGSVPGVIPGTRIGPNVLTYVTIERHRFRKPYRLIKESLEIYYGFTISAGEIRDLLERASRLLGPVWNDIVAAVQVGRAVHCDETGWYIDGQRVWAWAYATQNVVLYEIAPSRSTKVAAATLGSNPNRTSIHDGYTGYFSALDGRHQLCWAHLTRDSKDLTHQQPENTERQRLHQTLRFMYRRLLKLYRLSDADWTDWKARQCRGWCEAQLRNLRRARWKDKSCQKLVNRLVKYSFALFSCTHERGIPPDNNHAERVVRKIVIQRKISGGNRSPNFAQHYAKTMSVLETFRLQGKDLIAGLQEAFGRGLAEQAAAKD